MIAVHILGGLALLSFLISIRLSLVFNKLKNNTQYKEIIPLVNIMLTKNIVFALMSVLIITESVLLNFFPEPIKYSIHEYCAIAFVSLLFFAQIYLYWLVEWKNGWH